MSETYFVQLAFKRPAPPKQEQLDNAEAVAAVEEVVDTAGNCEKKKRAPFRQLTDEQRRAELKPMHDRDNSRVRGMFNLLDKEASGEALPEGTRVRQGDMIAPGLVISANPFPSWLDGVFTAKGFAYDEGCISYIKAVEGKEEAEKWYLWVWQLLKNDSERPERPDGEVALWTVTELHIREDHTHLLGDLLT